jgi:putative transcriptional regulator
MSPTPEQIRAARAAAGLTQSQAAALIGKPVRTWQNWEAPEGLPAHRKMDAAFWELFLTKIGRE